MSLVNPIRIINHYKILIYSCLNLYFVPRTGIEPALPCENQILSLARLPIPPSGHYLFSYLLYGPCQRPFCGEAILRICVILSKMP